MSVFDVLATNGFVREGDRMEWGTGSLVWGHYARVSKCGDRYLVRYHYWYWDGGSYEEDLEVEQLLYPAEAISFLFSRLPLWRRR